MSIQHSIKPKHQQVPEKEKVKEAKKQLIEEYRRVNRKK